MKSNTLKNVSIVQRLGLTAAAIICSIALLNFSSSTATAAPDKAATTYLAPNQTGKVGKYMMSYQAEWGDGNMNWYVMVWDTETGKSKAYYGNNNSGGLQPSAEKWCLPSDPLN